MQLLLKIYITLFVLTVLLVPKTGFTQGKSFPDSSEVAVKLIKYPADTTGNPYRLELSFRNNRANPVYVYESYIDGDTPGTFNNIYIEIEKIEINGNTRLIHKFLPDYFFEFNLTDSIKFRKLNPNQRYSTTLNPYLLFPSLENGEYRLRAKIQILPESLKNKIIIRFIEKQWLYFTVHNIQQE